MPRFSLLFSRLETWARRLKSDLLALWFCQRHPDTPLMARLVAVFTVAYAFSPIDLIPDFIPVLGYLDDLVIVPLGVYLALRLIPPQVLNEGRAFARDWRARRKDKPRNWLAAAAIVAVWIGLAYGGWRLLVKG